MYIKYICIIYVILYMLFDHFEEGAILKGKNHPWMKLSC